MNPNLKNRYNLESAIKKVGHNYQTKETTKEVREAINWIIYNNKTPIKDVSSDEMIAFEQQLAMLIHEEFIHNFSQLVEYLRKCWMDKYCPDIFFEIE
jgi:hypothetical protein